MTICQRIEWAGPGLSRPFPEVAAAGCCDGLGRIFLFVAAAALLLPLSVDAADAESAPSPDPVSTTVSVEAGSGSSPSFNLNFDTLLKSEGALQPLTGLN